MEDQPMLLVRVFLVVVALIVCFDGAGRMIAWWREAAETRARKRDFESHGAE